MIEMTHEDIERIWNSFSHYISDKTKTDAAIDYVNTLKNMNVDQDEIKASTQYDSKLEEAVESVFGGDDDDEEKYGDDNELVY